MELEEKQINQSEFFFFLLCGRVKREPTNKELFLDLQ